MKSIAGCDLRSRSFFTRSKESGCRASPRPRQQRRSGAARAQEEAAARGRVPRDEAPPQLREAVRATRPREGRGRPPLPQAPSQAHGARGLLVPRISSEAKPPGSPAAAFDFARIRGRGRRCRMIDHVSIAVSNLAASATLYARVLEPLGLVPLVRRDGTIGFGKRYPEFWLNS